MVGNKHSKINVIVETSFYFNPWAIPQGFFLLRSIMDLETQVERIKNDLHCFREEFSNMQAIRSNSPEKISDVEFIKLKMKIKATEKLLELIALDFKIE